MMTIREMMKRALSDMGFFDSSTHVKISGVSSRTYWNQDGNPVLEIWFWADPKKGKLMHKAFIDYVNKDNPDFDKEFFEDDCEYNLGIIDCQNGGMIIYIEG